MTSIWNPLVRSFIRSSIEVGWSGRRIYGALPGLGLPSYHRDTFLKVVRLEKEFIRVGKATIAAPGNIPFPHNLMVEEEFPMTTRYRLHGQATLYDLDLEEAYTIDIQMYSDSNLGKDGWESQFISRYTPAYGEEGIEVQDVTFNKIVHMPGGTY